MPHPALPAHRDGFLQRFLAELPGRPTLETLQAAQPPGQPLQWLGEYAPYEGGPIAPIAGASITPQFVVRCVEGSTTRRFALLWIVERIDVATDNVETMTRLLADFRAPSAVATPVAGADDGAPLDRALAARWAEALATPAVRTALARDLAAITEVPAGLPTTDLDELKSVLRHFASHRPDGSYVAKGAVAEGSFPGGVNPAYLAPEAGNVVELALQRDAFYCYALASERLWNPAAPAANARQLVYRIDDLGEDAGAERWRLALLHTAAAPGAGAGSRFVFFDAPVGVGLAVGDSARQALAPSTAALLDSLPARLAQLPQTLADATVPIVGTAASPFVLLIGTVRAGFPTQPLPEGVIEDGEGAVRSFRCPPQHVQALAGRDDVETLVAATEVGFDMQHAMHEVNLAARTFPAGLGITAATTGRGVVVGIVDSGIDGSHPAFLGRADDATKNRIHSVWNLWESGGQSPAKRSGNKAEYKSMDFGREYIGHDETSTVRDAGISHGSHCAGIAAGRAFGTWPGGISPAATIVVAATGTGKSFTNDVLAGVRYCFQKATELGLPCVVNISMSTQRHAHDGSDPLSLAMTQLLASDVVMPSQLASGASTWTWRNGRVVCASAGNLRGDDVHWQATIPAGGEVSLLYQPRLAPNQEDGITFWAYNDDASTVRLHLSTRHSSNAVLATAEVPLRNSHAPVTTALANGLSVNIHNGPQAPHNLHFNAEIYWLLAAGGTAPTAAPWIVRLRNSGRAPCTVHAFAAFRSSMGNFVFADATVTPLLGSAYSAAQKQQFDTHKIGSPGNAPGCICVACFNSQPGLPGGQAVGALSRFSSPGPLRATGAGRRPIDVTLPGNQVLSAKGATAADPTQGLVAMGGTSMATPVMTGLTAALLQMEPQLHTGSLRIRLENSSRRNAGDAIDDWGLGRVDAAALLKPL